MTRYCLLDVTKLAFTFMIAVFHLWAHYSGVNARGGFIAVEFFFILSGFFLMMQSEQALERRPSALKYSWDKAKKLYPHYIVSFLALFLYLNVAVEHNSPSKTLERLFRQASEVFMLYGTILSDEKTRIYNSMTWYLSVLLIVGYILWALLKEHKAAVLTAAPVVIFWIYAYMAYTRGNTNNWRTHICFGVLDYAALRGIAGMLLGCLAYEGSRTLVRRLAVERNRRVSLYLLGGGGGTPGYPLCAQLQMVEPGVLFLYSLLRVRNYTAHGR